MWQHYIDVYADSVSNTHSFNYIVSPAAVTHSTRFSTLSSHVWAFPSLTTPSERNNVNLLAPPVTPTGPPSRISIHCSKDITALLQQQ